MGLLLHTNQSGRNKRKLGFLFIFSHNSVFHSVASQHVWNLCYRSVLLLRLPSWPCGPWKGDEWQQREWVIQSILPRAAVLLMSEHCMHLCVTLNAADPTFEPCASVCVHLFICISRFTMVTLKPVWNEASRPKQWPNIQSPQQQCPINRATTNHAILFKGCSAHWVYIWWPLCGLQRCTYKESVNENS